MEFMNRVFLDNTIREWTIAVGIAGVTMIILRFAAGFIVRRLSALAERTETHWDDILAAMLQETKVLFLTIIGVYAGSQALALSDRARGFMTAVTTIAVLVQAGVWSSAALAGWLKSYRSRQLSDDPATVTTVSALGFVGKLVIWAAVLLLSLDNLGVDVTALVAGLGVGGIAVALAAQNILGDLFASLSIVLDKPFVLGDFLSIGDMVGNVEHIGLKTTRVRSLSGEQIVFSNADLLGSRIRNFGRMYQRRAVFLVGVTYQTSRGQLERIPAMIREVVEAQEHVRFDRSHFKNFGDFSLNFETVYYVTVPDYGAYMDVQQRINLAIYERFATEGIEFAYPTQTLFVAQEEKAS